MHNKILLIENDASITRLLSLFLDKNGYKMMETRNDTERISSFMSDNPDLILLDLGLPDTDDNEVPHRVRSQSKVPILAVSARGQERKKVGVLDLGADDYVTEPFHINELLAKVQVALCKKTPRVVKERVSVLDGLRVDFEKYKVYMEDREVHLTSIEFKLLVLPIEHVGKALTRSFIIRNIRGCSSCEGSQSLYVFITNIHRKIEKDSSHPRYVPTEVDVGYRFIDE